MRTTGMKYLGCFYGKQWKGAAIKPYLLMTKPTMMVYLFFKQKKKNLPFGKVPLKQPEDPSSC